VLYSTFMQKVFKILLGLCIVLLVVAGIGGVLAYRWYTQPVNATAEDLRTFIIPKGQATAIIGNRLHEDDFIAHPLLFRIALKLESLEGKIQAGSFEISPAMTPAEIAYELTRGSQDVWITVVEGWRMEQIAESLAEADLPLFDADEFKSLVSQDQAEGTLFPDTYLVPKQYTSDQIYSLLTNTFEIRVLDDLAAEIEASPYTLNQIMVMASLVEREAREYEEMRGVAGVLWQRIEIGMPLQVDATMQYAKGYDSVQQTWWAPPRAADKSVDSPFNTYQINGLPPRPIANPSLNAIKATLNPIPTKNLFYIHDRSGRIHYAETLEGHNANVNRYLR
jgi:UPF0755 protein